MSLYNDGYIIYRNKLSKELLELYYNCYIDTKVNYNLSNECIDKTLEYINLENNWNCIYTKYRVSNNNNSTDASIYHKDILCQKSNKLQNIPIYTCVVYLDKTQLCLIPKTHLKLYMNVFESIKKYNNSVTFNILPGDIVLFNSNLIHKGNFLNNTKNRRVIQIFDIFPNTNIYNIYINKIYHIPNVHYNKYNIMKEISKYKIINLIIFITYFNAATGYGNFKYSKTIPYKDVIFSSDGKCMRYDFNNPNYIQESNIYVHNKNIKNYILDVKEHEKNELIYRLYIKSYIITNIVVITLIIIIFILIKKLFSMY
jgi:hypothetical protein